MPFWRRESLTSVSSYPSWNAPTEQNKVIANTPRVVSSIPVINLLLSSCSMKSTRLWTTPTSARSVIRTLLNVSLIRRPDYGDVHIRVCTCRLLTTLKTSPSKTSKPSSSHSRRSFTPRPTRSSASTLRSASSRACPHTFHSSVSCQNAQITLSVSVLHLQQGDCVISKVLTFDLSQYPDANPNPNEWRGRMRSQTRALLNFVSARRVCVNPGHFLPLLYRRTSVSWYFWRSYVYFRF